MNNNGTTIPDLDYSKESFFKFLEGLKERLEFNPTTVTNWINASHALLDDLIVTNPRSFIREVNLDRAIEIAERKGTRSKLTLDNYRSLVIRAIGEYCSYIADPESYTPDSSSRRGRKKGAINKPRSENAPSPRSPENTFIGTIDPRSDRLVLPFPIRQDFMSQIVIPRDLTKQEVKRLTMFLTSLAIDALDGEEP